MKLTTKQLKQLIKEEIATALKEDLFLPPPRAEEIPIVINDINNNFDSVLAGVRAIGDYYASIRDHSKERLARTVLNQLTSARQAWRAGTGTPGTRSI